TLLVQPAVTASALGDRSGPSPCPPRGAAPLRRGRMGPARHRRSVPGRPVQRPAPLLYGSRGPRRSLSPRLAADQLHPVRGRKAVRSTQLGSRPLRPLRPALPAGGDLVLESPCPAVLSSSSRPDPDPG